GGHLEAVGVEDLRPDVAVDAAQVQVGTVVTAHHRHQGRAAVDGEAELLVLVRGGDVFVGVRLDAGGDPDHHLGDGAQLGAQLLQPGDLVGRVDDDPPDARASGGAQFVRALIVAVQADPARVDSPAQGDGELSARADVQAQTLLRDPPRHAGAQERLSGVVDGPAGEGVAPLPGAGAEVVLVDHVDRAADLVHDGR